ncbi:MAG: MFS transporter, partial [Actinomycetota bacterium]
VSPRHVVVGGAAGAALANLLLLAADGPELGIGLRFLTGLFLAGVYPPSLKLLSTWYRRGRGLALGILVGALTLGSAVPHLINGLGGLDVTTTIVATSVLTLGGGAIVAAFVHEGPFPFPKATFDPRQAGVVFRNRGTRLASLGYFGHMWELYALWAWFFVFFSDTASVGDRAAALATFAVIGIGALGCSAGGYLGDRWGRTRTTAAAMAASGACALTIGLLSEAPPALLLAVGLLWGFTVVADSAQFSTIVTEIADQSYVGTALTLQLALGFTLTVATIWLIPVLEEAVTWRWAFALLAPGPALGVVAMLRLRSLPEARAIAGGRG